MLRLSVFNRFFLYLICLCISLNIFAENNEQDDLAANNAVILYAGTLLDVPGKPPKSEQTLVIVKGKIEKVYDGYLSPPQLNLNEDNVAIVNLKENFVLPGLIDAHVHLLLKYGSKFRDPSVSGEEQLITGIVNARATLDAGFTTVADLDAGANSWPVIVLRNAIRSGEIPGPRILAAGSSVSPTGGHGDFLDAPDQVLEQLTSSGLCDGEAECRRAVRRQFRQGADLIKIHASGGGNERTGGKHHAPSFMQDEFTGIVETAHSLELKVTAHAHSTSGINAALKAGVDSIEHGSFLDKESIRLFKKNAAYLVPTLSVQDMIADRIDSVPAQAKQRMKLYQDEHPANVSKAWKAGVKLALGSDAGVVPHGKNVREVEWLVKIGVSEAEAIKIATSNTAEHLGLAKLLGKLEAGMSADIIAVSGDPLQDISTLQKVVFVMKEGHIFKQKYK
jgi:imidazolonepropionase-like amidohydrolase